MYVCTLILNTCMQVATSNTDIISSEMESSVQASLKDSVRRMLLVLQEKEHDDDRSSLLLRTIHQLQSLE